MPDTDYKQEIEKRVLEIITEKYCIIPEDVTPEKRLSEDLGLDSLDGIELIMEFEKEFDISISDEQLSKISTVGDIIKLVESLV